MNPPTMTKDTRRLGASIVLAAMLFAACSKEAKKGPDSAALGADSSLTVNDSIPLDLLIVGADLGLLG